MSLGGAPRALAPLASTLALAVALAGHARAEVPGAPPPPAAKAVAKAAPPHADDVEITFDPAEPNLVLERAPVKRDGSKVDSEGWTAMCLPGCTARLDRAARYQVAGTWVNPAPLVLPDGPGPFRVTATPGSARSELLGTGWLLAGGVTFALGGVGLVGLVAGGATQNQEAGSVASGLLVASVTTAAVGLALVLASLPFRAGNATHVHVEQAPSPPPPVHPPTPPAPSPAPSGGPADPRMF